MDTARPNRRSLLLGGVGMAAWGQPRVKRLGGVKLKLALNAYSFNAPLVGGKETLTSVVEYCAEQGIDALDATGYYFQGYPRVPADEAIYALKRHAFLNGVTICGTGVRNDFAVADAAARRRDVQMVKDWIEVAAKLGAGVIRVFSGRARPAGYTFEQAVEWMAADFRECAAYGQKHGVIVGLQNHNDFLKTAAETIQVVEAVGSPWFGVILDVGSLRQSDPYAEIERLLPYAVSWQLKENVGYGAQEAPTDLARIKRIIERGGYRGYLPVETLGAGEPREKVARFAAAVKTIFFPVK